MVINFALSTWFPIKVDKHSKKLSIRSLGSFGNSLESLNKVITLGYQLLVNFSSAFSASIVTVVLNLSLSIAPLDLQPPSSPWINMYNYICDSTLSLIVPQLRDFHSPPRV